MAGPIASIIVVNYRTPLQTRLCLRCLRRYSPADVQVIVVDNGSDDEQRTYLQSLRWLRYLANPTKQSADVAHRQGLDLGVAAAAGPVIVAMHSDCFVHRTGWLKHLLGLLDEKTFIIGSADRVLMPPSPLRWLLAERKRLRQRRRWAQRGMTPRIITHCTLYRRELFTEHAQKFDTPVVVGSQVFDAGEEIQRYCEQRGLGVRLLTCHDLTPWLWHFEAATVNVVTDRSLSWSRRLRAKRFYARADIRAILADDSLDR